MLAYLGERSKKCFMGKDKRLVYMMDLSRLRSLERCRFLEATRFDLTHLSYFKGHFRGGSAERKPTTGFFKWWPNQVFPRPTVSFLTTCSKRILSRSIAMSAQLKFAKVAVTRETCANLCQLSPHPENVLVRHRSQARHQHSGLHSVRLRHKHASIPAKRTSIC